MTVQERYEGIQSVLKNAGDEGCHFLALCSIADEYNNEHGKPYLDLINAIRVCQSKRWIDKGFWVKNDGTPFLEYLTGIKWSRKEVVKLPVIRDNDYTEVVWFNPDTGFHHYRRRYMDTLEHSVTVEKGYIEKYYVYTAEVV